TAPDRPVGTSLIGRRLYEVMSYWDTAHTVPGQPEVMLDYAQVWQAADKVVYSRTLEPPTTARTRVERDFDPGAVRELKAAAGAELSVGGAELAAQALDARLGGERRLFLPPRV